MEIYFLQDCDETYDNLRKRKCETCGFDLVRLADIKEKKQQTTSSGRKYIQLGEKSNINLRPSSVGEPILLNPNSYENLERILEKLKHNLGIESDRQWTAVGCDGPPYCLASRLIERQPKKFDWITMQPGLGHLNMNQLKGFFKVTPI